MEKQSPTSSPRRIAFYPCCAGDIEEPRRFLAPYVDEIIFCDLRRAKLWNNIQDEPGLPKATFLQGNVLEMISTLPTLTVLFYRNDSNGEGGSGLRILGKILLPLILARFDPAGGWIFSDGSNGGKTFRLLCSTDWHSKPSWGFRFRRKNGSILLQSRRGTVHTIELSPVPVKPQVMRLGWVPPVAHFVETLDSLQAYCTTNNRLVPMPVQWNKLYGMLKNARQKASGGWEPPLPLILAAWHHSMPIEKLLRFKEHLAWAQGQNQLEEIGSYLRSLPEDQWCHFGEI